MKNKKIKAKEDKNKRIEEINKKIKEIKEIGLIQYLKFTKANKNKKDLNFYINYKSKFQSSKNELRDFLTHNPEVWIDAL